MTGVAFSIVGHVGTGRRAKGVLMIHATAGGIAVGGGLTVIFTKSVAGVSITISLVSGSAVVTISSSFSLGGPFAGRKGGGRLFRKASRRMGQSFFFVVVILSGNGFITTSRTGELQSLSQQTLCFGRWWWELLSWCTKMKVFRGRHWTVVLRDEAVVWRWSSHGRRWGRVVRFSWRFASYLAGTYCTIQ